MSKKAKEEWSIFGCGEQELWPLLNSLLHQITLKTVTIIHAFTCKNSFTSPLPQSCQVCQLKNAHLKCANLPDPEDPPPLYSSAAGYAEASFFFFSFLL